MRLKSVLYQPFYILSTSVNDELLICSGGLSVNTKCMLGLSQEPLREALNSDLSTKVLKTYSSSAELPLEHYL